MVAEGGKQFELILLNTISTTSMRTQKCRIELLLVRPVSVMAALLEIGTRYHEIV